MKRKNLNLDEKLLREARQMLAAETDSATVNIALAETIRMLKIRDLRTFFGTGAWAGDLDELRKSRDSRERKTKAKSS